MKIAILISGQMRAADLCYPSIKRHLLDRYPDHRIFVHTSDDKDAPKAELFSAHEIRFAEPGRFDLKQYGMRTGRLCIDPERVLAQLWRLQESNTMLKEHVAKTGERFDAVVRLRPDTQFLSPLMGLEDRQQNSVYIPSFGNYCGCNDRFAYGTPEAMNHYFDKLYQPLDSYIARGGVFHPESILKGVLEGASINILRTNVIFDTVKSVHEALRPVWCHEMGDDPPEWVARRSWQYRANVIGYELFLPHLTPSMTR